MAGRALKGMGASISEGIGKLVQLPVKKSGSDGGFSPENSARKRSKLLVTRPPPRSRPAGSVVYSPSPSKGGGAHRRGARMVGWGRSHKRRAATRVQLQA